MTKFLRWISVLIIVIVGGLLFLKYIEPADVDDNQGDDKDVCVSNSNHGRFNTPNIFEFEIIITQKAEELPDILKKNSAQQEITRFISPPLSKPISNPTPKRNGPTDSELEEEREFKELEHAIIDLE